MGKGEEQLTAKRARVGETRHSDRQDLVGDLLPGQIPLVELKQLLGISLALTHTLYEDISMHYSGELGELSCCLQGVARRVVLLVMFVRNHCVWVSWAVMVLLLDKVFDREGSLSEGRRRLLVYEA